MIKIKQNWLGPPTVQASELMPGDLVEYDPEAMADREISASVSRPEQVKDDNWGVHNNSVVRRYRRFNDERAPFLVCSVENNEVRALGKSGETERLSPHWLMRRFGRLGE